MTESISVFLADDNLLVREGVRTLIDMAGDFEIVGMAGDFDDLVAGATATAPQVVVTDIRMPPDFRREGIEAAKLIRRLHPGTGVVVLSQYDDPEYAVSLLSEGAAGYAYLLKDRVAEGDQLARAIREVAAGGSLIDPTIVAALTRPVQPAAGLDPESERLLHLIAEGTPVKAIALAIGAPPADVDRRIEKLFVSLAEDVSTGSLAAIDRLKLLHRAIVDRKEQGEVLSRLLPGGLADKLRNEGRAIGETEELEVTVLMSDVRGYTTIAERTHPTVLAGQLNRHRAEMNRAILDHGGTVMQFVGDAVMGVFGAPDSIPDHADCALAAAHAMHAGQRSVNQNWQAEGLEPFGLGIGLSSGMVAAALLGSEERVEYSVVGDIVNLTQRLQQWAEPGETVLSEPTWRLLAGRPDADELEPATVKGRAAPVRAFRVPRRAR
ncbi:MAG: adenylate/guanylate cyclase domain-containing protein [Acidimicrobiia bacterium]